MPFKPRGKATMGRAHSLCQRSTDCLPPWQSMAGANLTHVEGKCHSHSVIAVRPAIGGFRSLAETDSWSRLAQSS